MTTSKKLYDYECMGGHVFEELTYGEPTAYCVQHDVYAQRLFPAPRIDRSGMALSASASPESIAHFDRVHRERRALEEKRHADHGDYGKAAGSD